MLSNYHRIILFQKIPESLLKVLSFLSKTVRSENKPIIFIENIGTYLDSKKPSKTALLSLKPTDWLNGLIQYPNIKIFNTIGLTHSIVKTLNEKGFLVDLIDFNYRNFHPKKEYDLYLGHGGNCKSIIEGLHAKTFILHYASGAFWSEFNRMSQERYDQFCVRKGIKRITSHKRSMNEFVEGEDYLAKSADATFLSGPRTIQTFSGISKNMHLLYLGAYINDQLVLKNKDFEKGRKNFIYVAGTGGNIQKGLDLLIEVFARTPELELFIYCKIEDELLTVYKNELKLKNIHYIYHYRLKPFNKKLKKILKETNFTISAAIDTGPGTAFTGSLGLGLIPVGYVDIEGDENDSCLANSFTVTELVSTIRHANSKTMEWCNNAARLSILKYKKHHEPTSFTRNFGQFLDSVVIKNIQ